MSMTTKHLKNDDSGRGIPSGQHGATSIFVVILVLFCIQLPAEAQLTRERVEQDEQVDDIFRAPVNVGIATVYNLPAGNLNSTVMHTFGLVNGGIYRFFGLDDGANTRIGLDYGITDRVSAGIGRMTFSKVVDLRGKFHVLRQTRSNSMPVDLAVKTSVGITTVKGYGSDFSDRLSYFSSLMIARKFDRISLQFTPMYAHFNRSADVNPGQLFGLGILANYEFNDRFSLSAEYLPVIGDRFAGSHDAMAVALNINTGGHVFQLFFTSSQWHNEQYIMANNRDRFWKGDFRFGFNINRVFGLGR